ncbi:aminopeptidase [Paucibacter sp. APW11]|uniref:Aminopeptidase n=1 Tax=Roseateles aquae TaxID=3077235 RepID=A0ABU3PD91_9BURK|nr:aminopeptidase [Paucibacter sp. APW11]MDT9000574.1 aminopeptidase [Paucibacter sp. APW11]
MLALATAALLLSGCAQLGYLAQSASGHLALTRAARPVDEWLADPTLTPRLREQLLLSQRLREFASRELALPDNNSYRRYADLQREAAVWNVAATPELSLQLQSWCFPLMGCVGYRGYFDRQAAEAFAATLAAQGAEVQVYPVPAYSTLGWSAWLGGDPLLNTFIAYPEGELARMIFHELAHQVAYAADDTEFNESFATAVERLGVQRWFAASQGQGAAAAWQRYRQGDQRREQFLALTLRYRQQLDELYRSTQPDEAKRAAKQALMAQLQADYQQLKQGEWQSYAGYDRWFAQANNASLAMLGTYNGLTPQFERLFAARGQRWSEFYAEVQRLAKLEKSLRRQQLQAVAASP